MPGALHSLSTCCSLSLECFSLLPGSPCSFLRPTEPLPQKEDASDLPAGRETLMTQPCPWPAQHLLQLWVTQTFLHIVQRSCWGSSPPNTPSTGSSVSVADESLAARAPCQLPAAQLPPEVPGQSHVSLRKREGTVWVVGLAGGARGGIPTLHPSAPQPAQGYRQCPLVPLSLGPCWRPHPGPQGPSTCPFTARLGAVTKPP